MNQLIMRAVSSDGTMQFVTPTLQVAAFAVAEPSQQNDKPGAVDAWHKRCLNPVEVLKYEKVSVIASHRARSGCLGAKSSQGWSAGIFWICCSNLLQTVLRRLLSWLQLLLPSVSVPSALLLPPPLWASLVSNTTEPLGRRRRAALPRNPRQHVGWSCPVCAPLMVDAFGRVRRRTSGTRLWTCCAGRAGTRIRSEALHQSLTIGRLAADPAGARPTIA
jgi:hypothetical protein